MSLVLKAVVVILLLGLGAPLARAERLVALELVLAVDCSSSVDANEYDLQMSGLADAFRHPSVLAAIHENGGQGIAIAMLQWSGATAQREAIGWRVIDSLASALAYADEIDRTARVVAGGPTGVGTAMDVAATWIVENDFEGERKVIDVSGDGRSNQGIAAAYARARANRQGITVNGLAILNEEADLHRYYLAGVVGGPGAFLLTAEDYQDFARAIERKLYFEISGPPLARLPVPSNRYSRLWRESFGASSRSDMP